jgi:hypothetical protein
VVIRGEDNRDPWLSRAEKFVTALAQHLEDTTVAGYWAVCRSLRRIRQHR